MVIRPTILRTVHILLAALLAAAFLAGCGGAATPAPSLATPTVETPAATNTPAATKTPYPTETARPSSTPLPSETPTRAPTATITPNVQAIETLQSIKMLGLAWYSDYDLLLSFQFPEPVNAEDYRVTLEDKVYNCEVLTQYPDRLYCKGQGAKVLAVADVRIYPAGQEQAGFEKEVWVPYFSNNYADVPK